MRGRLEQTLRPATGRDDQSDLRVQPLDRVHFGHGRGIRSERRLAVEYDGSYLYGDFVCGKFFQLVPDGSGGYTASEFGSGFGGPVDMAFGPPNSPSKALYYMTWTSPPGLYRITYTGPGNRNPKAVASADRTYGDLPVHVNFDASQSSDPDNDPLTYDWNFGDGSPHSSGPQATHDYTTAGTYTATLTVSDGGGGQDTATIQIFAGDNAPTPSISSPAANQLFSVGQTITLSGMATDNEDGRLADSSLTWAGREASRQSYTPVSAPDHGQQHHDHRTGSRGHFGDHQHLSRGFPHRHRFEGAHHDDQARRASTPRQRHPRDGPPGPRLATGGTGGPKLVHVLGAVGLPGERANSSVRRPGTGGNVPCRGPTAAPPRTRSRRPPPTHPTSPPSRPATRGPRPRRHCAPRSCPPTRPAPPLTGATQRRSPTAPVTPPAQTSGQLTVGTPDANGEAEQSVGSVRLVALPGNPSTLADEADARIDTSITDVRTHGRTSPTTTASWRPSCTCG